MTWRARVRRWRTDAARNRELARLLGRHPILWPYRRAWQDRKKS